MKVAVSFINSKDNINKTIRKIDETLNADFIHVDVMDGKFVSNKPFTFKNIEADLKKALKPLDVHLMVNKPLKYSDDYALLNTEFITIHVELEHDLENIINEIKQRGIKVGLSINPLTPITKLNPYLSMVDQVLVMSVEPGLGGQAFNERTINRLFNLNEIRKSGNYHFIISVDGGINDITMPLIKPYCDMVVVGTYICMSDNYEEQIKKLLDII